MNIDGMIKIFGSAPINQLPFAQNRMTPQSGGGQLIVGILIGVGIGLCTAYIINEIKKSAGNKSFLYY